MLERFTWFWQAGYRWAGDGLTVYIDPVQVPDGQTPADVIFITHAHFDHFKQEDIDRISKPDTALIAPRDVADDLTGGMVKAVSVGDSDEVRGIGFQAVPAYNNVEGRLESHPKENGWVGYVINLGEHSYYHAGDTDRLPELEQVRANVAFLPIGGGAFTMDGSEAGGLAKAIGPDVAVPMHFGFVEGCQGPGEVETFRREADPVKVEVLSPEVPFEF
jgi:L-ascorbate metabolism protein UlaG (beta-lactamase superfamily)